MLLNKVKYRIIISFCFVLLVLGYCFFFTSPTKGKKAPNFSVKLIDQSTYSLSDSQGNYVLLDFWGSWCNPCLREINELIRINDRFKLSYFNEKAQLDIVTIALEKKGNNWKKVAQKFHFDWKFQIVQFHKFVLNSNIANKYGVTEIPSKFLIDPNGIIILSNTSYSEIEKYLDSKEI